LLGSFPTVFQGTPKDLYAQDAGTIARVMATKKVSPEGSRSAIHIVQFSNNQAGKNLTAARLRELESYRLSQEKNKQPG
jgi:hypothetical protein